MIMRIAITTIQITTVQMPTPEHDMRIPHTPTQTMRLGMVITATLTATMPTPPLMPVVRRKLPGMLRERGTTAATPKSVRTMIVITTAMDTTVGIDLDITQ